MRKTAAALLGATILASAGIVTGALAQSPAPEAPAAGATQTPSAAPAPAQAAPAATAAPAPPAAPAQAVAQQGPANLCQEFLAYLKKPAPAAAAAAPAPPAPQSSPSGQTAAAPAGGAQQSGSMPQGSSAPAVEAPRTGSTPSAAVQAATGPQAASGITAPVPQAPNAGAAPTAKPMPVKVEDVEALARANDLAGCRDAAQKVRRVGAPMPPDLLALAGLKLELLQKAAPAQVQ